MAARSRDDLDNVRLAFEASLARGDLTAAVDVALGLSTLWRNAVSYAEGRRWVAALRARELSPHDRLWTLILATDVGLGSGDPRMMREPPPRRRLRSRPSSTTGCRGDHGHLRRDGPPPRARPGGAGVLDDACDRARAADEPGLERLARGFRVVALRDARPH